MASLGMPATLAVAATCAAEGVAGGECDDWAGEMTEGEDGLACDESARCRSGKVEVESAVRPGSMQASKEEHSIASLPACLHSVASRWFSAAPVGAV